MFIKAFARVDIVVKANVNCKSSLHVKECLMNGKQILTFTLIYQHMYLVLS